MSRKSRTIANRRDRRKAKQSGFKRAGRGNPKKKCHGGSGETQNRNRVYTYSEWVNGH